MHCLHYSIVYVQGISYDHVEMNFFLNGKSMDLPVTGIRGTVFPAIYGMLIYVYSCVFYEYCSTCTPVCVMNRNNFVYA